MAWKKNASEFIKMLDKYTCYNSCPWMSPVWPKIHTPKKLGTVNKECPAVVDLIRNFKVDLDEFQFKTYQWY